MTCCGDLDGGLEDRGGGERLKVLVIGILQVIPMKAPRQLVKPAPDSSSHLVGVHERPPLSSQGGL